MQIESRFNVHDKVWMMSDNRAIEVKIYCIHTSSNDKGTKISYSVNGVMLPNISNEAVTEDSNRLFTSKEELLKSL